MDAVFDDDEVRKNVEQGILLILGQAHQINYPTVLDNIINCDSSKIKPRHRAELILQLVDYAEHLVKCTDEEASILVLTKTFEISKQLSPAYQSIKMMVLAQLQSQLGDAVRERDHTRERARTMIYCSLVF